MACVCVETAKHPLIFRPLDERQPRLLDDWVRVIRNAVSPLRPGSVGPLKELEALMKRKDLTAIEAQRAQMLMKDHGSYFKVRSSLVPVTTGACAPSAFQVVENHTLSAKRNNQMASATPFCVESLALPPRETETPTNLANRHTTPDPIAENARERSAFPTAVLTCGDFSSGFQPTTRSVFMEFLMTSYPEAWKTVCMSAPVPSARQSDPPPDIEILTTVRDGDGNYEGYIAVNGVCVNACGVCVGYLNDVERTAGSPKSEYFGCITEPCGGEAIIERPNGKQLAILDLGRTIIKTITGSTIAEFKMNGEVIANLGHRVCFFDSLSFHDQPTMALYLSFINPGLLTKVALTQALALQPHHDSVSAMATVPVPRTTSAASTSDTLYVPTFGCPAAPQFVDNFDDDTPGGANRKCLAEFSSREPWQLSAKIGDALALLETHDDGWATCINANGCRGMLPFTYLGAVPRVSESSPSKVPRSPQENLAAQLLLSKKSLKLRDLPTPPVSPRHKGVKPYFVPISALTRPRHQRGEPKVAIASFDNDMSLEWQVSLALDEPCHVLENHGDGWALILKASGEEGMVPAAFLTSPPNCIVPPSNPSQIRGTVLRHFIASDLSWQIDVETDDEVELCEIFSDGWSSIMHVKSSRTGIVPSTFLGLK